MSQKNIVILHGWGASSNKFMGLAKSLDKLGWDTYVLKMPGFDKKPPKTAWGVPQYADYALKSAKKKFGSKPFFVFGHSFGGRLAMNIAAKEKSISGIVLCSAAGISRGNAIKRYLFWFFAKVGKTFNIYPKLASLYRTVLYKIARESDYKKTSGIIREIFKKVISYDSKKDLEQIKCPALILWGKQDKMTPVKDAYYIKSKLSGSKLKVYPNQGHKLPYEKADDIAQKINTWSQNI